MEDEGRPSGSKEKSSSSESTSTPSPSSPSTSAPSATEPTTAVQDETPAAIPVERQRNYVVKPGYAYFLVTIPFTQGMRFGLGVKHYRNQVIVSKVESGSMAGDTLKILDRVCDVCSVAVSDKDVCKKLIVNALQNKGEVDMIIERPVEPEAISANENALNASRVQAPSVAMAPDVKSIVRRYNEKLKMGFGQMLPKKALSDPNARRDTNAPRVGFQDNAGKSHMSLIIGCDRTPSQVNRLKRVKPKPNPSSGS